MITEKSVEDALMYLATHVEEAAAARAHKIFMEEGRKVKKAQLMRESNESQVNAQERHAYAHPDYAAYLVVMKEAIYEDAKHTFKREAVSATIEAWRTQQANIRAAERVT